ncbi:MAG: ParB/RepB/Spo0J family partition protein [Pseudomonadota bacterium]
MQLNHIPLDDLTPAKLNVRKQGRKEFCDLLPSLRAHGLLQPLLVRAAEDGFEIVAGQRRYHALKRLAEEQDNADAVPCLIMEQGKDAEAIEASLAENVARLPMDEIDQYKAFAALSKQGLSTEDIAARFGITTWLVTQRLAIARIIPPILTAFRKGDIAADTLRLPTMATKSQQREWLRLFKSKEDYTPEGYRLKAWLFGGKDIKTETALFDLEAYPGPIISDLFGDASYFADAETFWTLQNTAIAAAKDAYLAKGWSDVVLLEVGEYSPSWDYPEIAKADGGKVYVQINQSGEVTFHEGRLSRKEIKARSKGEDTKTTQKPELTAAMQNHLALHRHAAVRDTLLVHQGMALRLAVAQMIAGSELWRVEADPQRANKHSIRDSLTSNKAEARFAEERKTLAEMLCLPRAADQTRVPHREDYAAGRDLHHLFKTLCDLDDDTVLRIMTFVVAECLPVGSAMVEVLGQQLDVSLPDDWSPDDAFFDLLRDKQAINAIVGEIAGDDIAAQHVSSTAKVQKSIIKACLDGTRPAKVETWQPRYMTFPMYCYANKLAPKAQQSWDRVKAIYSD